MAATVLHSFNELAKLFSDKGIVTEQAKKKAKRVIELATYANVEEKCGRKGAIIWAFLNDQECCKRYGAKGEHIHSPEQIAIVTGFELTSVVNACISLVTHGFARLAANGQQIKAA